MNAPRPGRAGGVRERSVRAAAAHVYVTDLEAPALGDDDRHHLLRVLRLRPGEPVSAADGEGGWLPCRLTGEGELEPAGPPARAPRPDPLITIALAVPKGDRAEWAVQKLTEVGADRIIPLVADRSVVRWPADRAGRQVERWRAIARAAAMQSRRLWLPQVEAPRTTRQLLAAAASAGGRPALPERAGHQRAQGTPAGGSAEPGGGATGAVAGAGVALAEPGGEAPGLSRPTVVIGPEGGWTEEELEAAPATVALGPSILRTETAAVVAATLLAALRSGLVGQVATPPGAITPR